MPLTGLVMNYIKSKINNYIKKDNFLLTAVVLFVLSRIVMYLLHGMLFSDFSIGGFVEACNRFDSNHYRRIASLGYLNEPYDMTGEAGWAFFPLYPVMIGGLSKLLGASVYSVAFVVGGICAVGAAYMGAIYIYETTGNREAAYIYIYLLMLGCYSFYLSAFYTESPFLFLLTLCFYFLYKKKYLLMGLVGILLCLTRNVGIFFEFVIVAKLFTEYWDKRKEQPLTAYLRDCALNPSLILGMFLIPAGFFGFVYYLYRLTGDGFAFLHVQVAWGREQSFFLVNLLNDLKLLSGMSSYTADWGVLGFYLVWLMLAKERNYYEALWGLLMLILPMQSSTDSVPRYMFGAFVFLRILSSEIAESKWYKKLFLLIFIAFYEIVLLNGWFYGDGVLI